MDDVSAASDYTGRCLWIQIRWNDKMILRKIIFVSLILRENYSSSSFSCFNNKKTRRNCSVMKSELMPEQSRWKKKQQQKTQKTSPGWFFAPSFARHFVYESELMFECSNDVAVVRNRCRLFYDIIACLKRSLSSQHDDSSEGRAPRKWMNSALLANYWNENSKWWCGIEWIMIKSWEEGRCQMQIALNSNVQMSCHAEYECHLHAIAFEMMNSHKRIRWFGRWPNNFVAVRFTQTNPRHLTRITFAICKCLLWIKSPLVAVVCAQWYWYVSGTRRLDALMFESFAILITFTHEYTKYSK